MPKKVYEKGAEECADRYCGGSGKSDESFDDDHYDEEAFNNGDIYPCVMQDFKEED